MKTIFLTLLLVTTLSFVTLAQTQKGRWLLGAQIGDFNYQHQFGVKKYSASITPSAGYFLANGLVLGTAVPMSINTQKSDSNYNGVGDHYTYTSIGLSPFIRYFIGTAQLKPYFGIGYSYSKIHSSTNGTTELTSDGHATALTPTAGVTYFFTRNLALNAGLTYTISHQEGQATVGYSPVSPNTPLTSSSSNDTKTLSLGIGLLIVVGK